MLLVFCFIVNNFYSYSGNVIVKHSDKLLDISGDVKSVLEKEIIVKGERFDPIWRNVISETLYNIVSKDTALIQYTEVQGITSVYNYSGYRLNEIVSHYTKKKDAAGKTTFHYNRNGEVAYELSYDRNGNFQDSIVIEQNKKENWIIRRYFNRMGNNFKNEEIWFNSKGKETKNIQHIGDNITRFVKLYDKLETNITEERWYLEKRLVQLIYYEYDSLGYLVKKIECDEKDKVLSTSEYTYDRISGLVTSIKTGNNIISYEYNFDGNDNWIIKYEFYNDYPSKVIQREITYFDSD